LTQTANDLSNSTNVRAVILTATGRSFCAGGDLGWMKDQANASRADKDKQSRALASMLTAFDTLKKPVIGRIAGNAFGGGLGLIAVCDLVFATTGIKMMLTETKLGLIPATIGPFVLRAMGPRLTRQVFFSGRIIDNDLALRSGLVSKFCDPQDLDSAVDGAITDLLTTAPNAVSRAKLLLAELNETPVNAQLELTADALSDCWEDAETQSRISNFLDKK
jgi:methylglutaconyl-CoA hydratase